MIVMNVHEAKSQLSKLLDAAERGEEVFVLRRGTRFQIVPAPVPDRSKLIGALSSHFTDEWMEQYGIAEKEFNDEMTQWLDAPLDPERDR